MVCVSVVMPAYNVAPYVRETVAAVGRQTFTDFELVAVDDGSTDGTPKVLAELAREWERDGRTLVALRQANGGAAAARNTGTLAARGDYVAFLDADDRWLPPLLEQLLALLQSDPGLDIVFPRVRYIDEIGSPLGITSRIPQPRFCLSELVTNCPIHTATGVMVRKDALLRAGGFDTRLRACIDLDCWFRVAAERPANVAGSSEVLAEYRRRGGQITGDWRRMKRGWLRAAAKVSALAPDEVRPNLKVARAHQLLYWSTLAYVQGDYSHARRQIAAAGLMAPRIMLTRRHFWVRSLACVATLLPTRAHEVLGRSFNAFRNRLGIDLS